MDDIYQQIVKWSSDRPLWLRDALRRLVLNGSLEQRDYNELADICKTQRGIDVGHPVPKPLPLTAEHVPNATSLGGSIALTELHNFRGINRISQEAKLSLEPVGLNVVYGENGAGKSGYTRVLKKICRARGNNDEEIYQDIFSEDEEEQGAEVNFTEGGQVRTFKWEPDALVPQELSAISVFDSECALVHVDGSNELAYQPFGLDLMTRVAEVATTLSARFRADYAVSKKAADNFSDFLAGTQTYGKLNNLHAGLSETTLKELFEFTGAEKKELTAVAKQLSDFKTNDPGKKILELSGQIRRLEELNTHLDTLVRTYSKPALDRIVVLREKLFAAKETVALSRKSFEDASVQGVGGDAWMQLWESARRYFEHEAYPTKTFPVDRGVRCVLCQQELSTEAKDRLRHFEGFVQAEAQQAYDVAQEALVEAQEALEGIEMLPAHIKPTLQEDIPALHKQLSGEITEILKGIKILQTSVPYLAAERCSALELKVTNTVTLTIKKLVTALEKERNTYIKLQNDSTAVIRPLEHQANELQAAQQAARSFERIRKEISRQKLENKLESCIADTDTTGITRKADALSKVITKDLCQRFSAEAKGLDVGNKIDISLEVSEAKKGASYHQIVLSSSTQDVPVSKILSEGENRAIALASFLTEVALAPFPSAIVLDDPVSSLDHKRRERIARRLVEEATKRQVIVFTHDLRFVFDLQNATDTVGGSVNFQTAYATNSDTGRIDEGLPWEGMTAEARLKTLRGHLQRAGALYKADEIREYKRDVKQIYRDLRETWERAVELNLLGGVVTRFNADIRTKKKGLMPLVDISAEDCEIVDAAVTRCSNFAHDAAFEGVPSIPPPDEVSQDIEQLWSWISEIKTRRAH
jgi:energy-coupling factor transporter ATP-binding protein EcfA2